MNSLITPEIKDRLISNWPLDNREVKPVVKIFSPYSTSVWLLTSIDPNRQDHAVALCDLGCGEPEIGYVSISELSQTQVPIFPGVEQPLERDLDFNPNFTLGVYYAAAVANGAVTEDDSLLMQAYRKRQKATPKP